MLSKGLQDKFECLSFRIRKSRCFEENRVWMEIQNILLHACWQCINLPRFGHFKEVSDRSSHTTGLKKELHIWLHTGK